MAAHVEWLLAQQHRVNGQRPQILEDGSRIEPREQITIMVIIDGGAAGLASCLQQSPGRSQGKVA